MVANSPAETRTTAISSLNVTICGRHLAYLYHNFFYSILATTTTRNNGYLVTTKGMGEVWTYWTGRLVHYITVYFITVFWQPVGTG